MAISKTFLSDQASHAKSRFFLVITLEHFLSSFCSEVFHVSHLVQIHFTCMWSHDFLQLADKLKTLWCQGSNKRMVLLISETQETIFIN